MSYPDGHIDPNGKTFRYLTMFHSQAALQRFEGQLIQIFRQALPPKVKLQKLRTRQGLTNIVVIYKNVAISKQKVSDYAKNVVKLALKESGMIAAVITSTMRTPKEQAEIMLRNARKNYQKQIDLYGRNGDVVLKVYQDNKKESDAKIIDLMVKKSKH